MKKPRADRAIRRIVVALDPSMPCRAALCAATELASSLRAQLIGLLVEDMNLIRLAELPFAQEIRYLAGDRERLDGTGLRRALKVQVDQVRTLMEEEAGRARVEFTLKTVRGDVTRQVLEGSRDSDLVILGRARKSRTRKVPLGSTAAAVTREARQTVLLVQQGTPFQRPLLAVYDGSMAARRALQTAAQLGRVRLKTVTVILVPNKRRKPEVLRQEAIELTASLGVTTRFVQLPESSVDSLISSVRALGQGVLVIGGGSAPARGPSLQELLEELDNPVFIVR